MASSLAVNSLAASDECFRAAVGGGDGGEPFGETGRVGAPVEGDVGLDEQWGDAEHLAQRATSFIGRDTRLEQRDDLVEVVAAERAKGLGEGEVSGD